LLKASAQVSSLSQQVLALTQKVQDKESFIQQLRARGLNHLGPKDGERDGMRVDGFSEEKKDETQVTLPPAGEVRVVPLAGLSSWQNAAYGEEEKEGGSGGVPFFLF
jgi:hypothetical protein